MDVLQRKCLFDLSFLSSLIFSIHIRLSQQPFFSSVCANELLRKKHIIIQNVNFWVIVHSNEPFIRSGRSVLRGSLKETYHLILFKVVGGAEANLSSHWSRAGHTVDQGLKGHINTNKDVSGKFFFCSILILCYTSAKST